MDRGILIVLIAAVLYQAGVSLAKIRQVIQSLESYDKTPEQILDEIVA